MASFDYVFWLAALAGVSGAVLLPRSASVRPLWLGLRWKPAAFRKAAALAVNRAPEVAALRAVLNSRTPKEHTLVTGPSGVGASTLVLAALRRAPGVVTLDIDASETTSSIVGCAREAMLGNFESYSIYHACRPLVRVVLWHRLLFWRPPTLLIRTAAPSGSATHRNLHKALLLLCKDGMRIVVDACDSSTLLGNPTDCLQARVNVEGVSRAAIEECPALQDLHAKLAAAGLSELAWAVLGGNFGQWLSLRRELSMMDQLDAVAATRARMQALLDAAAAAINRCKSEADIDETLLRLSADGVAPVPDHFPDVERHSVAQVLRVSGAQGAEVVVPATPAAALCLRYAQELGGSAPTLDFLQGLVSPPPPVAAAERSSGRE